jgi:hypothetical protein
MAGLRVSDIARVALASRGQTDWVLAGLEVKINGEPLASGKRLHHDVRQALAAARARLNRIKPQIVVLERSSLEDTDDAEALDEHSRGRHEQWRRRLAQLVRERRMLEAQLRGAYPWFIDDEFRPPWRVETLVSSVQVTVSLSARSSADTRSYVYFGVGGHKYLLESVGHGSVDIEGLRSFDLNLDAGPLVASDLRGWAVGMLADATPQGPKPDQWDPERVVVQLDGRVVYDSNRNPPDRLSLSATRLIPPVHVDQDGEVVVNALSGQQVTVWEAGKLMGLDIAGPRTDNAGDGSSQVPSPDTASVPSSAPFDSPSGAPDAVTGESDGVLDNDSPTVPYPPGGAEFSEVGPMPLGDGGSNSGGLPGGGSFSGNGPLPGAPLPGGGGGGAGIPPTLPALPVGSDPPPTGKALQVSDVAITSGWRTSDSFTIEWKVSGDESDISHYDVALRVARPDQIQPYFAHLLRTKVPPGTRKHSGKLDTSLKPAQVYYYLAPSVVAVPKDPGKTPHERIGPIRAVFPASAAMGPSLNVHLENEYYVQQSGGGLPNPFYAPVAWGGDPGGAGRAVWPVGKVQGHNAVLYDKAKPAWNVAVRPGKKGESLAVGFVAQGLPGGQYRLIAHTGFLGSAGAATSARMEMTPVVQAIGTSWLGKTRTVQLVDQAGGSAAPLPLFEECIDTAKLAGISGPFTIRAVFKCTGSEIDPKRPPGLFGLRLLPVSGSGSGSPGTPPPPTTQAELSVWAQPSVVEAGQPALITVMPSRDGQPIADAQVSLVADAGVFESTGNKLVLPGPHKTGADGRWTNNWTCATPGDYGLNVAARKGNVEGTAKTRIRVVASDLWPGYYKWPSDYPQARESGWSDELQDVTHDDQHWYFSKGITSDKYKLWKFPVTHNLNDKVSSPRPEKGILGAPMPADLAADFNHFGGLDCHQGFLYVALEAEDYRRPPRIVVFRANDLAVVGHAELPSSTHPGRQASWCAIDPNSGLLYTSESDNVSRLSVFRPLLTQKGDGYEFRLVHVGWFPLLAPDGTQLSIDRVQSGDITENGHLYLVSDQQKGGIFGFSLIKGRQEVFIDVQWDSYTLKWRNEELEGITIWDVDRPGAPRFGDNWGGQVHLLILDNDWNDLRGTDDFHFRHWRVPPGDLDKL